MIRKQVTSHICFFAVCSRLSNEGVRQLLQWSVAELNVSILNKDLLEFLSGFLGGSCVAPIMPGVGTHLSGGKVLKVEGVALHHYSTYFEFILLWTNCVFFSDVRASCMVAALIICTFINCILMGKKVYWIQNY